jgi:hypothetical protein
MGETPAPARTPSMGDKAIVAPPVRTTEQYEADCKAGIQRIGRPVEKGLING